MKQTKYFLPHLFALIVISILAAIVTFTNLGFTKEFIGDDAGVGFHFPDTKFSLTMKMWDQYTYPGQPNVIATLFLLFISFIKFLDSIGLGPVVVDRILYFTFFLISGTGMYLLCSSVCRKLFQGLLQPVWLASMAGGIFYMFNNFTMILLSFPPTSYILSYIYLPWIFLVYLANYHVSKKLWQKFLFCIITVILIGGNPANTVSIFFILIIYEVFFRQDNKVIHHFKEAFTTLLIFLLLSSYMYLPMLGNKANPYGIISSDANKASISFSSVTTSLDNLLRFRGMHSQSTYIFEDFLLQGGTVIVNYLLIALALIPLFLRRKNRQVLFLSLLFILFIFLAKAEHTPFVDLNQFLYAKVPLFEMYRASWYKFIYFSIFSVCILLSISLLELSRIFSSFSRLKESKIPAIIIFFFIFFGAIPFFAGMVAKDVHKSHIPQEYLELNSYLFNQKNDFSILSLPLSSGLTMDWGNGNFYGGAAHPDSFLTGKPVLHNDWYMPTPLPPDYFSVLNSTLKNSNIKYILLHKDIPESYSFLVNITGNPRGQTDFKRFNEEISSNNKMSEILNTDYFKIFKINREGVKPHIYSGNGASTTTEFKSITASKIRVRLHRVRGKVNIVSTDAFDQGWRIYEGQISNSFVNTDIHDYKIFSENEDDQATSNDVKEFLTKGWITTLGDHQEKKIFHKDWRGSKEIYRPFDTYTIDYISKISTSSIQNDNLPNGQFWETWLKKEIKNDHKVMNGYQNGWMIDTEKLCSSSPQSCKSNVDGSKDIEIIIDFWPQRLFEIGLIIAIFTFTICTLLIIYKIVITLLKPSLSNHD